MPYPFQSVDSLEPPFLSSSPTPHHPAITTPCLAQPRRRRCCSCVANNSVTSMPHLLCPCAALTVLTAVIFPRRTAATQAVPSPCFLRRTSLLTPPHHDAPRSAAQLLPYRAQICSVRTSQVPPPSLTTPHLLLSLLPLLAASRPCPLLSSMETNC